jgi:multiple sugar transport system permease protein
LISSVPEFNPTTVASAASAVTLPELAFATLISVAPVLIIFLFSQRFLVTGLTAGATKE